MHIAIRLIIVIESIHCIEWITNDDEFDIYLRSFWPSYFSSFSRPILRILQFLTFLEFGKTVLRFRMTNTRLSSNMWKSIELVMIFVNEINTEGPKPKRDLVVLYSILVLVWNETPSAHLNDQKSHISEGRRIQMRMPNVNLKKFHVLPNFEKWSFVEVPEIVLRQDFTRRNSHKIPNAMHHDVSFLEFYWSTFIGIFFLVNFPC